jgi:hypothetical protein
MTGTPALQEVPLTAEGTPSPAVRCVPASKRPPTQEEVEAFEARKLQATLAKVHANLALRGITLSEESLRPVLELPPLKALQVIHGIDGQNVRDPARLLAWKLKREAGDGAPAAASPRATPAGTAALVSSQPSAVPVARSVGPTPVSAGVPGNVSQPSGEARARALGDNSMPIMMPVHCPGCGEFGEAPRKLIAPNAPADAQMIGAPFSSSWGSHRCGASWMCTQLPQNFGTGVCLAAWLRRGAQGGGSAGSAGRCAGSVAQPEAIAPLPPGSALAAADFPIRCCTCGTALNYLAFERTTHGNKFCAQWHCRACPLTLVGSITAELEWNHFTAFWVNVAEQ